ncbi:MAG: hypothetical protein LBL48_06455 [Azoarcus sp.]|jgi:hypothetical protein|nr:hypothetical protein [Azoarcus sp.]
MLKKIIIPILLVALLGGCRTNDVRSGDDSPRAERKTRLDREREKNKTDDPRECAQNFTFDGSFIRGRTFKTIVFVKGVSQSQAVKRAARYLTTSGYQINSADENLGIISASQTVSYGKGKTVPLNVGIEGNKGGVRVNISFVLSGGVTSPVDAVRKEFCDIVEQIEGK